MTHINPHWEYLMSADWAFDPSSRTIKDAEGTVIAQCPTSESKTIDPQWNGWILAAAPDLLCALDSILHLLEVHASHIYYRDSEVTYADDMIKKATGEHLEV